MKYSICKPTEPYISNATKLSCVVTVGKLYALQTVPLDFSMPSVHPSYMGACRV